MIGGSMATPSASMAPQLRSFVARVRAAHRREALLHAALRTGLPGAAAAVLASWWSLRLALALGVATLVIGGVHVLLRWRQLQQSLDSALRGLGEHGFEDALRTWIERDGAGASDGMSAWLGEDLAAHLGGPKAETVQPRRLQLGPVRYLVPVLVVLWMVKLLGPDLPMPLPGVLGGGARAAVGGEGEGEGSGGAQGSGRDSKQRDPQRAPQPEEPKLQDEPPTKQPVPPEPPKPKPEPDPEPPPEAPPQSTNPPEPLLSLPEERKVVVPQFIGDGPTRRAMAEVALVPGGGGGQEPQQAAGGGASVPRATPTSEQFQAAAEKAQQSRHVPASERAIVKRFFALLQQGGK